MLGDVPSAYKGDQADWPTTGEVPRTLQGTQSAAQINNSSNILNDVTAAEIPIHPKGRNAGVGGGIGGTELKKMMKDSGDQSSEQQEGNSRFFDLLQQNEALALVGVTEGVQGGTKTETHVDGRTSHRKVEDSESKGDPPVNADGSIEFDISEQDNVTTFKVHQKFRTYDSNSLFLFKSRSRCRRSIVWLVNWSFFNNLIMLVIIANSILIASYDFKDRDSLTTYNQNIDTVQLIFQAFFVAECLLKIIAQGFIHKKDSYLRNGWNALDFIVIIFGLIDISTNSTNLKSLRAIRVLQPLRNITHFERLKHLTNTLIKSLPNFVNVGFFLLIIFIVFGIFGVQMYSISFYYRCRTTAGPELALQDDGSLKLQWEIDPAQSSLLCTPNGMGIHTCSEGTFCGNPYEIGMDSTFDNVLDEAFMNYGVLTFDNIGKALLSVFQILTNDNWAATMYMLMNVDNPILAPIFLSAIVVLGSFFLINIILAVILDSFISVQQEDLEDKFKKTKDFEDSHNVAELQEKMKLKIDYVEDEAQKVVDKINPLINGGDDSIEQQLREEKHKFGITDSNDLDDQKDQLISQLEEVKVLKNYIRDQMKFDLDNLKNAMATEGQTGSVVKLSALKRAIIVIDPDKEKGQQEFKKKLMMLRFIAQRAKKNCLYKVCLKISQSKVFNQGVIPFFIIINTAILASDKYPSDEQYESLLENLNFIFYFIFLTEVFVKWVGLGTKAYFQDGYNVFDTIIIMISSIDTVIQIVILSTGNKNNSLQGALSALRAFRMLRIFKLASVWQKFKDLLKTVWKTLQDIWIFTIFLFLFSFIYALLGMELFAFQCKKSLDDKIDIEHGYDPLNNFNSFYEAFLTMFVLLTGDQWTAIMLDYYRAVSPTLALIFFVSFMILGQYMLFNLFLAILLQNFDEDSVEQEMQKKLMRQAQIDKAVRRERIIRFVKRSALNFLNAIKCTCLRRGGRKNDFRLQDNENDLANFKYVDKEKSSKKAKGFLKKFNKKGREGVNIKGNLKVMQGTTLFIFSVDNRLRQFCYRVTNHRVFEMLILIVIVVSTIQLAMDNPLNDPNGTLQKALGIIDNTTTAIFAVELVMKVIAFGLIINGEGSYLRNTSNTLDFFVTGLSIVSTFLDSVNLQIFKILRLFKVLRPLRFITRIEAFQVAIEALLNAVTNVFNVLVISMLFFMIFAIVGINYFKGQFNYCTLDHTAWPEVRLQGDLITKWDCIGLGGEWLKKNNNFDNIQEAMMTLFLISTLSDWLNVMYDGMSITGVDNDMILKIKPAVCFYFIIFVIIGAFFTLNLFVGIVISTYNREKEKIAKDFLLKERQKEWLYAQQIIFRQKLQITIVKHQNAVRNFFLQIIKHRRFEGFILFVIIANTLVLTFKWAGEPPAVTKATEILNYIFTGIFTVEMFIKLIALGKIYFREKWNRFDMMVIVLTYVFIVVSRTTEIDLGPQVTLLRSFRVLRIFRFFKATKNLKIMFNTFIVTLPAMSSIGGLLALLIYVYAVLGVNVFSEIKRIPPLDDVQNFEGFGAAFLILIKLATGDGWSELLFIYNRQNSVMNECINDPSYEDYANNGFQTVGCGSNRTALLYFYSYLLVVKLIFLNLFIAVILDGFQVVTAQEGRTLNSDQLEDIREKWAQYDPMATGFISITNFSLFMKDLGEPIGWSQEQSDEDKERREAFVKELNLPIYNEFTDYQYIDVALALCKRLIIWDEIQVSLKQNPDVDVLQVRANIEKDLKDLEENEDNIKSVKRMKKEEKRLKQERDKHIKGNVFTATHEEAARVLIRHLRNFIRRSQMKKGIKVRRYTKEELEAIDAAVMNQFKAMVEVPEQNEEVGDVVFALKDHSAEDESVFQQTARHPLKASDHDALQTSDRSKQIIPQSRQNEKSTHFQKAALPSTMQNEIQNNLIQVKSKSLHESFFELSEPNHNQPHQSQAKQRSIYGSQDELMIQEEMMKDQKSE